MKNVYGLANAMKVVESACVEGEITIIGNGKMPTAEELYHKCVEYINSMYGVDILALVGNKCSCGCDCCDEDEDEDEEIYLCVDFDAIDGVIKSVFEEYIPFLKDGVKTNILENIVDYYGEHIDKICPEDYDEEEICNDILDILDDDMPIYDYASDYIDEFVKELVTTIDEECIRKGKKWRGEKSSLS